MMTLQEEAQAIYEIIAKRYREGRYDPVKKNYYRKSEERIADEYLLHMLYNRINQKPELLGCIIYNKDFHGGFNLDAASLFMFLSFWRQMVMNVYSASYIKQEYDWLLSDVSIIPKDADFAARCVPQHHASAVIVNYLNGNDLVMQNFVNIDKLVDAIKRQVQNSKDVLSELSQKIINVHFTDIKCKELEIEFLDQPEENKITLHQRQRVATFINRMRLESVVNDKTIAFCSIDLSDLAEDYAAAAYDSEDAYEYKYGPKEYRAMLKTCYEQDHRSARAVQFFATQTFVPGYEALRTTGDKLSGVNVERSKQAKLFA